MPGSKYYFIFFILLCSVTVSFSQKTSTNSSADKSDIEKCLTQFSTALSKGDSMALANLCGSGFTLLEDGKSYDFANTLKLIKEQLRIGEIGRSPSNFSTEVRGTTAWSWYNVSGEFRTQGGSTKLTIIESVVLEKTGKQWKVVLMNTLQRNLQKLDEN